MPDMIRKRFLWLTDTHLNIYNRYSLLNSILNTKPAAVFLTGDISNFGNTLHSDLEFLGKRIGRPLYFVIGNHDVWFSDMETTHKKIKDICSKYKNLVWMTDRDIISLNEEVALIGDDGWYSPTGNIDFLKWTFDWFMIQDFKKLPNMAARIEKFKELAKNSANILSDKLERALENHKTVYLLTHIPAWREANRCNGFLSEKFWEPYNTNIILGEALEKVMSAHKKKNLIVLSGHTHSPVNIHVNRSIECRVGRGNYLHISEDETIYI